MRDRAVTNTMLAEQATQLRREREENAMLAGQIERARIARELHDVLTHSVSVMVIQAQAAQSPGADTKRMLTALARIESVGKRSLVELRDLLQRLRPENESPVRSPQPSLAQLEALLAEVRATGIDVAFTQEGTACDVPIGVELSAYRIVQEALTNTIRHTSSPVAAVTVRYLPGELEVEVSDDGPDAARPANGGGRGLTGMRERAALLGGSLIAEPRPEGGFLVSARLPCP
jgi:signal transduction histidine kinase